MVGTVSAARRLGERKALVASEAAFALGLLAGASLVFGALGLAGAALHPDRAAVAVAVAVALVAAAIDAAGRRVRPQIRLQVPERWRRTMPLPRALFLYGVLLGMGFTTFVPAAAAWALLPLSLAAGSVGSGVAIGLGFAAGRALPLVVVSDETSLAERPRGLRVLRVLAALSLALALTAGEGHAATTVAKPAGDPSVAGTD